MKLSIPKLLLLLPLPCVMYYAGQFTEGCSIAYSHTYNLSMILQKMMMTHRISLSASGVAAMRQVDQKLIFIPVMFFLLRLWGTIQFIVASAVSIHQCQCVSHDAYVIISILAYLQVSSCD